MFRRAQAPVSIPSKEISGGILRPAVTPASSPQVGVQPWDDSVNARSTCSRGHVNHQRAASQSRLLTSERPANSGSVGPSWGTHRSTLFDTLILPIARSAGSIGTCQYPCAPSRHPSHVRPVTRGQSGRPSAITMATVRHIGRDRLVLCPVCRSSAVTFAPYVRGGRRSRSLRCPASPTVPSTGGKPSPGLLILSMTPANCAIDPLYRCRLLNRQVRPTTQGAMDADNSKKRMGR